MSVLLNLRRMDVRILIGRNFARIRHEKGLTQEEVANLSGFSQQYLSGLERGLRNPTVGTLSELAQSLGVTFWDLTMAEGSERAHRRR
jgi:transcriptional regulator with XRE-family HTH domain